MLEEAMKQNLAWQRQDFPVAHSGEYRLAVQVHQ